MKKIYLLICVLVSLLSSCGDMLENIQPYLDKGEKIYVGKVDSLEAFSGKNRILLKGLYMYGVTQKKCVVSWYSQDNELQQKELEVNRVESVEPFEAMIDNLDEGQYEFTIVTYDAQGNSSIESIVEGYAYGELYESNLTNRRMDQFVVDGTDIVITWRPADDALKSEVYYTGLDGEEKMIEVPIAETQTRITDCAYEGSIRWRTVYLPEVDAIDEFYSEYDEETYSFYVERELDKSKFKEVILPGDIPMNAWGKSMSNMWNGEYSYDVDDINHSNDFSELPIWFTFDLGVVSNLTRFVFWQRSYDLIDGTVYLYNKANFKKWEVWGCADTPAEDGSWDGWTKLATCEITKPSGSPLGTVTDEDIEVAKEGHEFIFPEGLPAVRYIRFKLLENFGNMSSCYVKEVTFYGVVDPASAQ